MFMTSTAVTKIGQAATTGYIWARDFIKQNNASRHRAAAQLQSQVSASNSAWWANLQAQSRAYQTRVIESSPAAPGSSTQLGLAQDKVTNFAGGVRIEHIVLAGAAVLLLMKRKK